MKELSKKENIIEKKYKITIFPTQVLSSMKYEDLELHYDEVMQDCTELIQYLKNVRERLLIYLEEKEHDFE